MSVPSLFVHTLTNLDFSYLDANRGLVGETWLVDAVLDAPLDEQGMVMDFGKVKPLLKRLLEETVDHKLLVPGDSPRLVWQPHAHGVQVDFTDHQGHLWQHISPEQAVVRVPGQYILAERVQNLLQHAIRPHLPAGMEVRLHLRPEAIAGAYYHYSHGLKKHAGDCQRIAHGHRSPIHVLVEGRRDEALERQWAERFRDIYIGSREDIVARTQSDGQNYLRFAYESAQGHFQLTLPEERCYLIDSDSTVELIATHLATETARQTGKPVRIIAYEGYQKGAIATA